jgi:hypothetical protein
MKTFKFYRYHRIVLTSRNDVSIRLLITTYNTDPNAPYKVSISAEGNKKNLGKLFSHLSNHYGESLSSLLPEGTRYEYPDSIVAFDMDHATEILLCLIELWKPIGSRIRLYDHKLREIYTIWEKPL